jgi:hypothetical protein
VRKERIIKFLCGAAEILALVSGRKTLLKLVAEFSKSFSPVLHVPAMNFRGNIKDSERENYEFSLRFDDRVIRRRCKPFSPRFRLLLCCSFSIIQVANFFLAALMVLKEIFCMHTKISLLHRRVFAVFHASIF